MDMSAKVSGLDDVLKVLQEAFPNNPKKQQQIVHSAMGAAARKTMLPMAKQAARRGDGSGALSEALKIRVQPKRQRRNKAGGMEMTPVRHDKKAIAKYIQHYYTRRGRPVKPGTVVAGIRHGHLVEFGHNVVRGGKVVGHVPANSFLWSSAKAMSAPYFAALKPLFLKRIDSAVRRERKKRQGK